MGMSSRATDLVHAHILLIDDDNDDDDDDVVYGTDPPYFAVRPRPFYQRQLMQSVHLPCVATGDPTPTIIWRRVS